MKRYRDSTVRFNVILFQFFVALPGQRASAYARTMYIDISFTVLHDL